MLGYVNPDSMKRTLEGGQVWFYSRSREELWQKGEVSGNYLNFKEAYVDCDGDTLLLTRNPVDITESVREARSTVALVVLLALVISTPTSLAKGMEWAGLADIAQRPFDTCHSTRIAPTSSPLSSASETSTGKRTFPCASNS